MSSVESGPRLPSEKSGQVAAAAMVAAAGALAPAGAYGVNVSMARARQLRARAVLGVAKAPAGAKAPAAATTAAAATWPDFSDGNLGPDSTDDNPGICPILDLGIFSIFGFVTLRYWVQVQDGGLSFGNFYITRSCEED